MERSRANGPGDRVVIWLQGCTLACPGCFNPETHSCGPRLLAPVEDLIERITAIQGTIEGVTISGGEPLQQPGALVRLVKGLRAHTSLSLILFTGYSLLEARSVPHGDEILHNVDVVIAGRFVRELRAAEGLCGSSNQIVHLVTNRCRLCDLEQTPAGEISIDSGGMISLSGINPPRVIETVSREPGRSKR